MESGQGRECQRARTAGQRESRSRMQGGAGWAEQSGGPAIRSSFWWLNSGRSDPEKKSPYGREYSHGILGSLGSHVWSAGIGHHIFSVKELLYGKRFFDLFQKKIFRAGRFIFWWLISLGILVDQIHALAPGPAKFTKDDWRSRIRNTKVVLIKTPMISTTYFQVLFIGSNPAFRFKIVNR